MNSCDQKIITTSPHQNGEHIAFVWLLRLRWALIASQALMVYGGLKLFHIQISIWLTLLVIGLGLTSNIFFYWLLPQKKTVPCWVPTSVMIFDVILMTALFSQLVSTFNPASILYIIYIILGALLLNRESSYILTTFTIVCYAFFFYFADPIFFDESILNSSELLDNKEMLALLTQQLGEHFKSVSYFILFVFFLVSLLVVYPIGQIKKQMEKQHLAVKELEEEKIRNEKLASLATFAAGAAHEFSTPLSTIAIAAGEMLFYFKQHGGEKNLIDDARLIRDQVGRCKEILYQMSADSGKLLGESVDKFRVKELVYEAMALFNLENLQQINFSNRVGELEVVMPVRTLARTLRVLLKNAMDASSPESPIQLICRKDNNFLYFEVIDQGEGMDPSSLKRAMEPFYTSKQPGKGMGLGLYLAKIMANRFGGDLKLTSEPEKGTTAALSFSMDRIKPDPNKEYKTVKRIKLTKHTW